MFKYFFFLLILITPFTGCALLNTTLPAPASQGAKAYRKICGTCHALAHPMRNTYAQWEHILGIMEKRMVQKHIPPMTTEEKGLIHDYLKKHSR